MYTTNILGILIKSKVYTDKLCFKTCNHKNTHSQNNLHLCRSLWVNSNWCIGISSYLVLHFARDTCQSVAHSFSNSYMLRLSTNWSVKSDVSISCKCTHFGTSKSPLHIVDILRSNWQFYMFLKGLLDKNWEFFRILDAKFIKYAAQDM